MNYLDFPDFPTTNERTLCKLDELILKDINCPLEDVLNQDELFVELRSNNKNLVNQYTFI